MLTFILKALFYVKFVLKYVFFCEMPVLEALTET